MKIYTCTKYESVVLELEIFLDPIRVTAVLRGKGREGGDAGDGSIAYPNTILEAGGVKGIPEALAPALGANLARDLAKALREMADGLDGGLMTKILRSQ